MDRAVQQEPLTRWNARRYGTSARLRNDEYSPIVKVVRSASAAAEFIILAFKEEMPK